jgi:hypothetical protein
MVYFVNYAIISMVASVVYNYTMIFNFLVKCIASLIIGYHPKWNILHNTTVYI